METKQPQPRIIGSSATVEKEIKNGTAMAVSATSHLLWRFNDNKNKMGIDRSTEESSAESEGLLDEEGLLQIEESDGTLVVSGDLDLHQAPEFRERAESYIHTTERPRLDLARVPFLDSAGLAALLALSRIAKAQNKAIRLIATGSPRRVLKITGIDRVLLLED